MCCNKSGKKVLVIDDCLDNLLLIKFVLESQGYSCKSACSGKKGLAEISQEIPDLIVLDMMMPDMSGLEVIACLKASDKFAHIPILLCTAHRYLDREDISKADDICYKPFNLDDLISKVEYLIACCLTATSSALLINDK